MGKYSKKEWLQWQLAETQNLLELSKDSKLMSTSLSYRIEDIEKQIKELDKVESKEATKQEMKNEIIEKISSEIEKGINSAREAIKPYGATIPKSDITVIIKDGKGLLQAIKTITV